MNSKNWIRVEDALPNDKEYVLVYINGDIDIAYCNRTHCTWWSDWLDYVLEGVSHWMPLPEQPDETI